MASARLSISYSGTRASEVCRRKHRTSSRYFPLIILQRGYRPHVHDARGLSTSDKQDREERAETGMAACRVQRI